MLIPTTIILLSNTVFSTGQYNDLSVVHVRIENPTQIQTLRDAGARSLACFDHGGDTPMLLDVNTLSIVQKLGLHFEIIEENIDQRLSRFEQSRAEARSRGAGGWYADYKTWTEVNDKLLELENNSPEIATHIIVGQTYEGRDIHGIRITAPGDASNRKQVLFNGCQHAREWVSVMVPVYVIETIIDNWYTDPSMQSYLETTEVIVVPIVNPDGYEFTYAADGDRFWRKNRRNNTGSCEGVDLNRNWSYAWNEGDSTSTNTCSDVYVGSGEFSEPETQAMRDLIYTLPNLVAHIDFHSYSQLILEPWASSNIAPPRVNIVKALSTAMRDGIFSVHGETYVAGTGGDLLYLADGVFPDWTTDRGALAYTIELRPTGSPGFDLPPSEILPTCQESYEAVRTLIQFINEPVTFSFPEGIPSLASPGDVLSFPVETILVLEEDIYPETMSLHLRYGNNGPFAQRVVAYDGDNIFSVSLPTSVCGLEAEFWFSVQTETGQTIRYPEGEEVLRVSTSSNVYMWNMDENPNWTTEGDWAWGTPLGGGGEYGNPDPTSGATGNNVLGYNLSGDYANNLSEQHLTTPSFSLMGTSNTSLRFQRYLNVEQPSYDNASISISVSNDAWTDVWANPSTIEDDQWQTVTYDISSRADQQSDVRLRWTMGTTDGGWKFSGWNIDDIQIISTGNNAVQGDVNCDGLVNVTDILAVVSVWGPCDMPCAEDIVPDGVINVIDLLQVIGNW